jgi:hypothetical protein
MAGPSEAVADASLHPMRVAARILFRSQGPVVVPDIDVVVFLGIADEVLGGGLLACGSVVAGARTGRGSTTCSRRLKRNRPVAV